MKRMFIVFAATALIAAGCKNYDDRFDDLNSQIATLTTQVQALQGVATQVSALNTEIGNIRSSIQGDIQTAVAGVSTTLGTNLESAQTALNGEIAKLQTALTQAAANNLTQADIDKLKSDLQTTLAAAQKTALDTALASLQAKLTELETALATAASGALSQADLDKLKKEIETQLAQVKEDLEESLGEGGFHSGEVTIDSSGAWEATKRQLASKTEFSGDFTIDTETLSDSEVDELIAWVAEITLIYGDLTVTHTGKEKVIKFAKLSSVTDLDDSQLHAHYPELTSAGTITLDDDIETVKLPKLTTLKEFAGHSIDLDEGTELTLSALASYKADLTIDLGGAEATLDLSALKTLDSNGDEKDGEVDLTIIGPDEVSLPELTTLAKLHVQDVNQVSAPKVKGADLQIGEDVISVNVGTEGDNHINALDVTGADDLETLQIGGNPATNNKGTKVILNAQTTPDLERAHIHGGFSVVVNGLDDVEEIITGRTITKEVSLIGTGVEGDLVLDHVSGANGILKIENNDDVKTLTADKVNKLTVLSIQGNEDLETISFKALKEAGTQAFGKPNWYDGDTVVIGGTTYGDADGFGFDPAKKNNLKATQFFHEVKKVGNTVKAQSGEIKDASGISDLKEFLGKVERAVVSYDSAEEFSAENVDRNADDFEPQEDVENDGNNLLLVGKGLAGSDTAAGKAKRVFLVHNGSNASPISTTGIDTSTALTIGVAGSDLTTFSRPITLTPGGSVKNWLNDINDQKVKDFFKTNDVTIEAIIGGHPTGSVTFNNAISGHDSELTATAVGTISLTVGDYSNTVTLEDIDTGDDDDDNDELTPNVPFSAENKKAKTYLDVNNSRTVRNIAEALIAPFPHFPTPNNLTTSRTGVGSFEHVPYGISDLNTVGVDNVAVVGSFDAKSIGDGKFVEVKVVNKIKASRGGSVVDFLNSGGGRNQEIRQLNIRDNTNTIQITLTSDDPGEDESTIGEPSDDSTTSATDLLLPVPPTSLDSSIEGATVFGTGFITELPIAKTNPRKSSLPKAGSDRVKADSGPKDLDRLGWL